MILNSLEQSLVQHGQSLEHFKRCLRVLERDISVCATTDTQSQQHYEWIQACKHELDEFLHLTGRQLLIDEANKVAIIVAAPSETTEDDKQMPRLAAYKKKDLENSILLSGLVSLMIQLEASLKQGRLGSKGEVLIDPVELYRTMDANFGIALMSNLPKQKLLFEAFEEMNLVARASGRPTKNSLAEESVVIVHPTIRLLMTPERVANILEIAQSNQTIRHSKKHGSLPESPDSILMPSEPHPLIVKEL